MIQRREKTFFLVVAKINHSHVTHKHAGIFIILSIKNISTFIELNTIVFSPSAFVHVLNKKHYTVLNKMFFLFFSFF